MIPHLDCQVCLLSQGLKMARIAVPDDPEKHEKLLHEWALRLNTLSMEQTVPHWAQQLYPLGYEILGNSDPYAKIKREANRQVMQAVPAVSEIVKASDDFLRTALNVSIIGNYIDHGPPEMFDWQAALDEENDTSFMDGAVQELEKLLKPGARMLILGDNTGEIALDTILAKVLMERGIDLTYAVRSAPILNDALMEDAEFVGMDKICRTMPSGCITFGTVLDQVSPELLKIYNSADIVLCKGQGNFEALYERSNRPVFFAFKAKCRVVADKLGCAQGSSMFICEG
ncbi:damage-control phosphatase ARMT1 family protein [Maridesulfovibrio sp.]|uniref:damage-control phosphatase ARMT1 family protein n=1 Tax=unclassified Maridesulfovibrio TaxID=2794999 RepID=UPI003B009020